MDLSNVFRVMHGYVLINSGRIAGYLVVYSLLLDSHCQFVDNLLFGEVSFYITVSLFKMIFEWFQRFDWVELVSMKIY